MTADPAVEVRGGVGGTAVGTDELVVAAGHLAQAAADLGELVGGLASGTAAVAASAPLSPVTALRAEVELVQALQVVALEAAALAGVATTVRCVVRAYHEVEEEVIRTSALAQDVLMAVAGHAAPSLVVGVVALDALGVDVGTVLDRAAWEVPELAELAGGTGGLVLGLRSNPLTAPFVGPRPTVSGRPGDDSGGPAGHVDPDEAAVTVLADSAASWGLLTEAGDVRVTAVPSPVGRGARGGTAAPTRPPGGLSDLVRDEAALDGRVRVVEVHGPQGAAWIVEIAGTQVWDPRAGVSPFDLTTDVRSMAAESTLLAVGVERALAAAQSSAARSAPVRRDVASEPVLLSGHSLGGIVAAGLASSAQFRSAHRVTHVIALGSPIGKVPVPTDVQVLAVEHRQDPVPRLEGRPNPDRASWVTVTRDLEGEAETDALADGQEPGPARRASAAHRADLYVGTAAAVDGSQDRSVVAWRQGSDAFFPGRQEGATAVVRDYRIARVAAAP